MAAGSLVGGLSEQRQYEAQIAKDHEETSSQARQINISEKPKISITKTEVNVTEEEVPFTTMQTYDGTLPKDTAVVRVEGQKGKKVVRTEIKTQDGIEIKRELISEEITVPPVTRIVAIGTKIAAAPKADTLKNECNPSYKPCIPHVRRDLDCDDIEFQVEIIGEDVYNLDEDDKDGIGCERFSAHSSATLRL